MLCQEGLMLKQILKSLPVAIAALMACSLSVDAQQKPWRDGAAPGIGAAPTDPVKLLYTVPGVRDNGGGAGTGVATSVHCTNFSNATEKLQYTVRSFDSSVKASLSLNIGARQTR